jgi:predicted metalloprotease with PDZ domain
VHQIRLAAHEYFHLAQYRLVGAEITREFYGAEIGRETPLGPNWLLEGSAEYFSWRVMQDAELLSLNDYVRRLDMRDDVDPADLETYLDFYLTGQDSYDASLRAVAFLLASNDEQDLMRYYFEIGRGETWRDAFRSSFGQSLESFYQAYGDYIASR